MRHCSWIVQRPERTAIAAARDRTLIRLLLVVFSLWEASVPRAAEISGHPAAKDGKGDADVVFPWRADKQGNVMLLLKLRYHDDGKPVQRESVVRVIPAEKFNAEKAKVAVAPTKLAKVNRRAAMWRVQKGGDVALMQGRYGLDKEGRPASETALVARIPAVAAGKFGDVSLKPPAVVAGQRPNGYWSRGADGNFVLIQDGQRVPIGRVSAGTLAAAAYLDEDYDGILGESETYTVEESGFLDDLDDGDDADFKSHDEEFVDEDGDGLDDDGEDDDEDEDEEDDDYGDDDENGDFEDD